MKKLVFLSCLLFSISIWAATFNPIPIEKQLQESSAVLHGIFLGETYKKLSNDEIITEASFKIVASSGIRLENTYELKVNYPGGVWGDSVRVFSGAPKFKSEEEVVLVLAKDSYGYWVHNLAMGKYLLQKEDGKLVLVSELFPEDPSFGKMKYESFNKLVLERFGEELQKPNSDKYISQNIDETSKANFESGRAPASSKKQDTSLYEEQESNETMTIVVVFAILAFVAAMIRRRNFNS